MKTYYSPGPWTVGTLHRSTMTAIKSSEGDLICVVEPQLASPLIAPANAALIAAAPELLAKLEELHHELVMDDMSGYGEEQQAALAGVFDLIKKAKGE